MTEKTKNVVIIMVVSTICGAISFYVINGTNTDDEIKTLETLITAVLSAFAAWFLLNKSNGGRANDSR